MELRCQHVCHSFLLCNILSHSLFSHLLGLCRAKVEGIGLKAAGQWGRDSSVVNDPVEEPGRTPLYVGCVDSDLMFFLYVCRRARFCGLRQTYMKQ